MNKEYELDCFGEICPIPILRIQNELQKLNQGDVLKVVTDHSCVVESILDYMRNRKYSVKQEEVINGVWEIIISLK